MIYMERTIEIKKGRAVIDETIYLYKGDKNIEIRFAVENNPFKPKNSLTVNYGQLIIKREKAPDIFSEVTKMSGGKIIFVVTGEMIDELDELGNYTFQIRLFNEDMTSRGTLPPVEAGICIIQPLCEEPLDPPKVYINPDFYEIRTNGGTNYSYLFNNILPDLFPDLSTWDTNNVTDMSYMFYSCGLTELNLSSFNTSNVTTMRNMFYNCTILTSLDVSNFDTSKVTDMQYMFYSCNKLTTLDLNSFDTSNVTNMYRMFYNCSNLKIIIGELDLSKSGKHDYTIDIVKGCKLLEIVYFKNIYKDCTMTNASKWSINLGDTIVKDECLVYIINELPDLINDKGLTSTSNIILTLPTTNTLTAEQVQIAIDKGWNVANTTY